jgi:flavin reductase (DIM6/NTAB) family NADH-FMN oxidoreductase RutF
MPLKTLPTVDDDGYKALARRWAATVNVVTVKRKGGALDGFTCTSFTPVSMAPPLILVSAANAGSPAEMMQDCESFVVNLLSPDQHELGTLFSLPHAARGDVWAKVKHTTDAWGAPLLAGSAGAFSAKVHQLIPAGDHTLVLGAVLGLHHGTPEETLLYVNRAFGRFAR